MTQLWQTLKLYFRDRVLVAGLAIGLTGWLGGLGLLYWKQASLPSEIPLWYTREPSAQLAGHDLIWLVPTVAAGCWLLNLVGGLWLYRKFPTTGQLLAWVAAGIGLMALVAVIKTIQIYTTLL